MNNSLEQEDEMKFAATERYRAHLRKRHAAERRFKFYGRLAVVTALLILATLLTSITYSSLPAFTHHNVLVDLEFTAEASAASGVYSAEELNDMNWSGLANKSLAKHFPDVESRRDRRAVASLLSMGAGDNIVEYVQSKSIRQGDVVELKLPVSDDFDLLVKGLIDRNLPESDRIVSDQKLAWIETLESEGRVSSQFAYALFQNGDSREPEMAGIKGAFVGTLWTMFITLLFSLPIGVMAAIYLQEIAPKNRLTDIVEVNINNLAAVPSIVFGLLGLAVFINFFHLPRSAPLVGGLVLALMTLPTIIIATRAALASVPPSIREAALGVGASRFQVIFHHVLPLALPGILTGTIIGLAQAAGETAPLLMIGMMAFIVDTPMDVTDKATVLPAQIYMWANNPERAFVARTSAGIVILLSFLITMNAAAIYLRKHYERRW
ncbi:phosphate ABC transporter permease PstA [Alphaproteobacteria bacterium]|nr:phosphate ABC transporter permease PstA [Alphaproteobacteria bacterium]